MEPLRLVPTQPEAAPAPPPATAASTLANLQQILLGHIEHSIALDPAISGHDDAVAVPRSHLARMLELVRLAAWLQDPPLAAARGLVLWLLALGFFGAGMLVGMLLF